MAVGPCSSYSQYDCKAARRAAPERPSRPRSQRPPFGSFPVEQPLGETLPGLVTTWLYDPDGVTNYFAEIRPRQRPAPPSSR